MVISVLAQEGRASAELAKSLGIPLALNVPEDYYLCFENGQLVVRNNQFGKNFVIAPDFKEELDRLKRQRLGPKKDLLCRALGFKGQPDFCVFDATLGFAKDALHLIALGIQVVGCEKNKIVFSLLESAIDSLEGPIALEIINGDSGQELASFGDRCQALYIDPMFEDLKKKSAPKKNLAFLRALVSPEFDVQGVISNARSAGIKRVVVKRPVNSENLYGKPDIVYEGKLIRYDVYTK